MESLGVQEENIIKDIKNFSRLKKLNYAAIKDIKNLFRLEKETKAIKDGIPRYIKNILKDENNGNLNAILSLKIILIKLDHI